MIDAFNHHTFVMALVPSFEALLLEVHQGLGLKRDARKKKFLEEKMPLANHQKMAEETLEAIFNALEMDALARRDAGIGIMEWLGFHKSLELNIWTGNASEQQVLWHLLAYSYIPGLARRLAFWSLAGIQYGRPFDAGMPGGEFWFLPAWDEKNGKLTLPMTQVIDWLLDLLNTDSLQELNTGLGPKSLREREGNDSVVRTLYNWSKGGTPQSAKNSKIIFLMRQR